MRYKLPAVDGLALLIAVMIGMVCLTCNRLNHGAQGPVGTLDAPLSFCELARTPDRYTNKTVRVRSTLIGYHELAIYDATCGAQTKYIRVDFETETREELVQKVTSLGGRGMRRGNFWVDAILVGRFEKIPESDCKNAVKESGMPNRYYVNYCYRIAVDHVEQVETVPETVAWPE